MAPASLQRHRSQPVARARLGLVLVVPLAAGVVLQGRRGASLAAEGRAAQGSGAELPPEWASLAGPACPKGMGLVRQRRARFCVDRYEGSLLRLGLGGRIQRWPGNRFVDGLEHEMMAVSRPGVRPQGYISGVQADLACSRAGKRLCTLDEWALACGGPQQSRYPYGNRRRAGACNDRFRELTDHPVPRLFRAEATPREDPRSMWLPGFMNDPRLHELPRTVASTGSAGECTNEFGAFDMVGNLHEWVADPGGVFAGGYFMDTFQNGEGCEYRTRAHRFDYHDYSTGFRCCVDAGPDRLVR